MTAGIPLAVVLQSAFGVWRLLIADAGRHPQVLVLAGDGIVSSRGTFLGLVEQIDKGIVPAVLGRRLIFAT